MAWRECIKAITAAAGRELTADEVEAVAEAVQRRAVAKLTKGMDARTAASEAGRDLAGEATMAAMIEKRSAAINVLRKQELMSRRIEGREIETMRAILTGVEGTGRDMGRSVDAQGHALRDGILGPMQRELKRAGVWDALDARDKAFERDVARELWRVEDPEGAAETGNAHARKAAEILHKWQEVSRARQNEAGAWIGKLDHYITRQSHDTMKVRGDGKPAAFQAWADFILPRLDMDRTLPGAAPAEVNQFLANVWKNLASGIHDTSTSDALAGFKGPGNLAKKVSQERKLHFKDADAWFDYQEKFGRGGVVESVLHGIERAARDTALMRTFGTNPEAMYQTVMKQWAKDARDRGDVALAAQIEKDTWTKKIFDTVTGDASRPGEGVLHTVGRYNRAVEQMAKLGGVVLSSLPDLVVNAAMLRHNGVSYWAGLTRQIGGMLPKGEATRGVAESIGAGMDGAWGGIMHRFQAEDGALGKMSEAVRIFHKWNGLTWWTDNLKQSAGLALSNNLAQRAGVAFDALPARMQTTLRRYGIEAAEWDGIRATAQRAADGRHYIVPEDLADRALADKLQTYYTDQIREGMTEATAGSRTAATWGTRADTIEGELVRTLMQFKTYTTTFMMRSLGRELRRDGVDVGGVASMIAGLTVMGYVSMTLKELAKGRNPRIPEDGEDWSKLVSAAFIQGGGLGLYGDFLFGDNNRMGGGFFDSLMGPTAGNISSLAKLVSDMREGSHSKTRMQLLGSDGLKIARDNTPFINLFYTQAALNYLIVYRMQEALNPGYLRRYEQRVKRENNQTFWLHPTGAPTMAAPDRPSILGGPR